MEIQCFIRRISDGYGASWFKHLSRPDHGYFYAEGAVNKPEIQFLMQILTIHDEEKTNKFRRPTSSSNRRCRKKCTEEAVMPINTSVYSYQLFVLVKSNVSAETVSVVETTMDLAYPMVRVTEDITPNEHERQSSPTSVLTEDIAMDVTEVAINNKLLNSPVPNCSPTTELEETPAISVTNDPV